MSKCKFALIILILAGFVLSVFSCSGFLTETYYRNGMVVSASPIASEIGLNVLKKGGNAADAAVAVGFALAVCYPQAGNIGGGGFALCYSSQSNQVMALDFREKAPGLATRDMYLNPDSSVVESASLLGARAAGVPGTVAGLFELWRQYGSQDWYSLIKPAIQLADTGFVISEYMAGKFKEYKKSLTHFETTRRVFLSGGKPPSTGDKLTQKQLALTLERIALDSTDGFYTGATANMIVSTMEKHNGLISFDDLKNYFPVWRIPVQFSFDSLDIYSMPPPSSGGVILGEILKLVEPYDFYSWFPDHPEYIHVFTEACRLAYADRAVHLGDPDFVRNPITDLLDSAYINSRRNTISIDQAGTSREIGSGLPDNYRESESTTHFSIVDSAGNAISLTYTINTTFGSKLVVDGAGFLLNNEMDDFAIKPGTANAYGLVGGRANEIAPGKRMLSSMSPSIVMKNNRPYMVIGSPGGSKIITSVAETILNFVRYDMPLSKAVAQPRFHHQWLPDTLYIEENGFDASVEKRLAEMGHAVRDRSRYSDVQAIYITPEGLMSGASDPRGDGAVSAY